MQHLVVVTDEPLSTREPVVYCKRGPFGPVTIARDVVSLPFLALPLPQSMDSNRYPLPAGVHGLALFSTVAASSLGISQQGVVSIAPSANTLPVDAQLVELEGEGLHDARAVLAAEQIPLQLHGRALAVGSTLCTVLGHKVRVRSLLPSVSLVVINRGTTKIKCFSASLAAMSLTRRAIDWQQRLTIPFPSSVLGNVSEALGAFISPPHAQVSLLIHGAPGTGKTSAAVAIASALTLPSHFIASASLLRSSEEDTRSEIAGLFHRADRSAPCVIIFDDLDSICRPRAVLREALERYAVTSLLQHLDSAAAKSTPIFIVATARDTTSMDGEVLSRFRSVQFPLPSPTERAAILRSLTQKIRVTDDTLREVATASHGFVSADLTALVRYAALNSLRSSRLPVLTTADFTAARRVLQPSLLAQHAAFSQSVSLERIVGMDAAVKALMVAVVMPFSSSPALRAMGIASPSGVLLHGPPGCGKTLAARAAARDSGANVIEGAEILSKLVGESEKAIARLFARAQQVAPAVLLFDQFEFLGRHRTADGSNSQTAERIVSCLLSEMDNIRRTRASVLVLATAASPHTLDPALLQPGRLEQQIGISLPSPSDRLGILRQRFAALPVVIDEDMLVRLADRTAGFSSAALQLLCEEAAMVALREDINATEIRPQHFEQALQRKQTT